MAAVLTELGVQFTLPPFPGGGGDVGNAAHAQQALQAQPELAAAAGLLSVAELQT